MTLTSDYTMIRSCRYTLLTINILWSWTYSSDLGYRIVRLCIGRISVNVLLRCNTGNWGNESLLQEKTNTYHEIKGLIRDILSYLLISFHSHQRVFELQFEYLNKRRILFLHSQTSVHFSDASVLWSVPILVVGHPGLSVKPPGVGRRSVHVSAITAKSESGLSLWSEGLCGQWRGEWSRHGHYLSNRFSVCKMTEKNWKNLNRHSRVFFCFFVCIIAWEGHWLMVLLWQNSCNIKTFTLLNF